MAIKCPKCGYQRQAEDTAPAWQCPSCGVAYAKVLGSSARASLDPTERAALHVNHGLNVQAPTGSPIDFPDEINVRVTDIRMPFMSMVIFMVKWAIAAIPAALILGTVLVVSSSLISNWLGSRQTLKTVTDTSKPAPPVASAPGVPKTPALPTAVTPATAPDPGATAAPATPPVAALPPKLPPPEASVGMTAMDVRGVWGEPAERKVGADAESITETWIYPENSPAGARTVVFVDGRVRTISPRK